jgi:hypothetical protein
LLCAGLGDAQTSDPRDGEDGGARHNGSIESRFHRVTPYAAGRAAPCLLIER